MSTVLTYVKGFIVFVCLGNTNLPKLEDDIA